MALVLMSDSRIMPRGDEFGTLCARPVEKYSQLEITITGNARVGGPAVQIIVCKRLHYAGGERRPKIEKRMRNAKHSGDFCSTAMIGTDARTAVFFPHA